MKTEINIMLYISSQTDKARLSTINYMISRESRIKVCQFSIETLYNVLNKLNFSW